MSAKNSYIFSTDLKMSLVLKALHPPVDKLLSACLHLSTHLKTVLTRLGNHSFRKPLIRKPFPLPGVNGVLWSFFFGL